MFVYVCACEFTCAGLHFVHFVFKLHTRSTHKLHSFHLHLLSLQVLASVRQMRNRLLEVHSNTESSLTKDAVELKRVVEGTIEDIAELHTEVERKKALSVHNEKTADEYRDRLAENVRTVIQSVLDFNSGQTALHSELSDMVMAMKDQNQKDVRLKNKRLSAFLHLFCVLACCCILLYSSKIFY